MVLDFQGIEDVPRPFLCSFHLAWDDLRSKFFQVSESIRGRFWRNCWATESDSYIYIYVYMILIDTYRYTLLLYQAFDKDQMMLQVKLINSDWILSWEKMGKPITPDTQAYIYLPAITLFCFYHLRIFNSPKLKFVKAIKQGFRNSMDFLFWSPRAS